MFLLVLRSFLILSLRLSLFFTSTECLKMIWNSAAMMTRMNRYHFWLPTVVFLATQWSFYDRCNVLASTARSLSRMSFISAEDKIKRYLNRLWYYPSSLGLQILFWPNAIVQRSYPCPFLTQDISIQIRVPFLCMFPQILGWLILLRHFCRDSHEKSFIRLYVLDLVQ